MKDFNVFMFLKKCLVFIAKLFRLSRAGNRFLQNKFFKRKIIIIFFIYCPKIFPNMKEPDAHQVPTKYMSGT